MQEHHVQPQPQAGGGTAAVAAVVSGTPVEGQPDWAAYNAPDGRIYYYNATTGVSSWEKPGGEAPPVVVS